MNEEPLTRAERDALLARHRRARALYDQAMDAHAAALDLPGEIGIDDESSVYVDTPAYAQARVAHAELLAVEAEYFRRLPRLPMAPCPYCGEPLHRTFDPIALDGLWWRSDAQAEEPPACRHFCLLLGAVALGEREPRPDFDVHPGPGVPYVVPRLFAHEGMTAVVGEIALADRGRAFPVAYFAPRRPPIQTLGASWARTCFVYTTQLGEHGWRAADGPDQWDFALERWVAAGRLRWCAPGSGGTALGDGPFPYRDLPGQRAAQHIRRYCGGGDPG
jgi:hypothetical protein